MKVLALLVLAGVAAARPQFIQTVSPSVVRLDNANPSVVTLENGQTVQIPLTYTGAPYPWNGMPFNPAFTGFPINYNYGTFPYLYNTVPVKPAEEIDATKRTKRDADPEPATAITTGITNPLYPAISTTQINTAIPAPLTYSSPIISSPLFTSPIRFNYPNYQTAFPSILPYVPQGASFINPLYQPTTFIAQPAKSD